MVSPVHWQCELILSCFLSTPSSALKCNCSGFPGNLQCEKEETEFGGNTSGSILKATPRKQEVKKKKKKKEEEEKGKAEDISISRFEKIK